MALANKEGLDMTDNTMEKTMEKITAQEALGRLAERYKAQFMNDERKPLIGLDINDYASYQTFRVSMRNFVLNLEGYK